MLEAWRRNGRREKPEAYCEQSFRVCRYHLLSPRGSRDSYTVLVTGRHGPRRVPFKQVRDRLGDRVDDPA